MNAEGVLFCAELYSVFRHSSERSEVKEAPIYIEAMFTGDRWTQIPTAFESDDARGWYTLLLCRNCAHERVQFYQLIIYREKIKARIKI